MDRIGNIPNDAIVAAKAASLLTESPPLHNNTLGAPTATFDPQVIDVPILALGNLEAHILGASFANIASVSGSAPFGTGTGVAGAPTPHKTVAQPTLTVPGWHAGFFPHGLQCVTRTCVLTRGGILVTKTLVTGEGAYAAGGQHP
tara:strand:+ start:92 stop:526 length:435 start_codon:yes stop_codon:yes gene_type:complete